MRDDNDQCLCIGGPLSRRYWMARGSFFRYIMPIQLPEISEIGAPLAAKAAIGNIVLYVRQEFSTDLQIVRFWVPEGQTAHQTLMTLIRYYEILCARTENGVPELARPSAPHQTKE